MEQLLTESAPFCLWVYKLHASALVHCGVDMNTFRDFRQ